MKTKICGKCKRRKLTIKFSKNSGHKDGLQSQCKKCVNKYKKQYYEKNKKQIIAHIKQYYKENREQVLAREKQRYKNNKKRITARVKQYHKDNPEKQKIKKAKRRELGFNLLNEKFPGSVAHHINKDDVIYIPELLHKNMPHCFKTGKNMERINKIAMMYLKNKINQTRKGNLKRELKNG
jgi:hypothetical protein